MSYRNTRLNPLLRFIYLLLRSLAWLGIVVFYRRRLLLGRENLRFDGPAIIVINHPNTLMDVLVPGVHIHQEMFFLANYGLFKNPVTGWLFRRLFCIPVKRREDVAEGEARNNDAAFEQCFQHLEKKGVLFIAAEGVSWMNRFVRELKTGAARIAFGAEARNNWKLDVKIVPIGLSYTAPNRFRSDSVVNVGVPVYPRDWAEAWQQDPESAVDELTLFLENQLKSLTVHAHDEAGEQLLGRLETISNTDQPLPLREEFFRSQHLANTQLDDAELRAKTDGYFENLAKNGLSDRGFGKYSTGIFFRNAFPLVIGFPFFLAGYAFWFLPCFLPWLLNKRLNLYIGYSATVKILAGLITFPLAMWGAFALARHFLPNGWRALAAVGGLVLLGLWAERWLDIWRRFMPLHKVQRFVQFKPKIVQALLKQRSELQKTPDFETPDARF